MRRDVDAGCCCAVFLHPDNSGIEEIKKLTEEKLKKLPIEIIAYFKGTGMHSPRECLCSCIVDILKWDNKDILFLKPLDGYEISKSYWYVTKDNGTGKTQICAPFGGDVRFMDGQGDTLQVLSLLPLLHW